MSKLDVKSAFRICPVHPSDWNLLGFSFQDRFFVDLCLPFGLRSSVNRFTQVADTILWILQNNYGIPNSANYLDDFFLADAGNTSKCQENLNKALALFQSLGVPLAPEKIVPPTECLSFLGIEINSKSMELSLPHEKRLSLISKLQNWSHKRKCTKRELLSLVGSLSFACKVVPSGRTFLRRLIDLSTSVRQLNHHITLNAYARADIEWWKQFLPSWHGKHKILDPQTTLAHDINLFTDASGTLGFGIYFNGKWVS